MRLKTLLLTLLVALMLVVGIDYVSYAATGGHAILGKINKAGSTTTFKRTSAGPAVTLTTKGSGFAPLATNGRGKVTNLNADLLDGRDSSSFATRQTMRVLEFTAANALTEHYFVIGALPAGRYLATFSVYMEGTYPPGGAPTNGGCHLDQSLGTAPVVHHKSLFSSSTSVDDDGGQDLAVSGSGYVTTALGNNLTLRCSATKPWTTGTSTTDEFGSVPAQITLTQLDAATVTTRTTD
jgi:hypothetical protein